MSTYQVNYEQKVIEGPLAGKTYHRHETFNCKSDAIFFAMRDGLTITPSDSRDGAYIQQNSEIVDLTEFLK